MPTKHRVPTKKEVQSFLHDRTNWGRWGKKGTAGVLMGGQGRSMRSQMRSANSMGVPRALIMGEDEPKAGTG